MVLTRQICELRVQEVTERTAVIRQQMSVEVLTHQRKNLFSQHFKFFCRCNVMQEV